MALSLQIPSNPPNDVASLAAYANDSSPHSIIDIYTAFGLSSPHVVPNDLSLVEYLRVENYGALNYIPGSGDSITITWYHVGGTSFTWVGGQPSWVTHVTGGNPDANTTYIVLSVDPNTGAERDFAVRVTHTGTGNSIDVNFRQSEPSTLTLSTSSLNFGTISNSLTVNATSNTLWNVTDNQSWISCSPTSGNGNASFDVTVQSNAGPSRSGTVTVQTSDSEVTRTVSINQASGVTLTVNKTSMSFTSSSGSSTFGITSNHTWTVTDNASWITCSPTSGSLNDVITVSVTTNSGSSRNGTITIKSTDNSVTRTISVSQAAAAPSTYSQSLRFGFSSSAACSGSISTYYTNNASFLSSTQLWQDSAGTRSAGSGYYSDGFNVRYWSGSTFSQSSLCGGGGGL